MSREDKAVRDARILIASAFICPAFEKASWHNTRLFIGVTMSPHLHANIVSSFRKTRRAIVVKRDSYSERNYSQEREKQRERETEGRLQSR